MKRRPIPDSERMTTEEMMAAKWNPRYLAYCVAQGACSVEEMKVRDLASYPGGMMTGYVCWLDAQWTEWRAERGVSPLASLSRDDHREFDAWLADRVICATASAAALPSSPLTTILS
jgi:hypothetical protein